MCSRAASTVGHSPFSPAWMCIAWGWPLSSPFVVSADRRDVAVERIVGLPRPSTLLVGTGLRVAGTRSPAGFAAASSSSSRRWRAPPPPRRRPTRHREAGHHRPAALAGLGAAPPGGRGAAGAAAAAGTGLGAERPHRAGASRRRRRRRGAGAAEAGAAWRRAAAWLRPRPRRRTAAPSRSAGGLRDEHVVLAGAASRGGAGGRAGRLEAVGRELGLLRGDRAVHRGGQIARPSGTARPGPSRSRAPPPRRRPWTRSGRRLRLGAGGGSVTCAHSLAMSLSLGKATLPVSIS